MSPSRKLQGGRVKSRPRQSATHLVIITGMSGSGKASVLKAFEDLDYYCVDNLPIDLIPRFADLAKQSAEIEKAALVADIREGEQLKRLPKIIQSLRKQIKTTVLFLEASDEALLRRFSETRRPHPLGKDSTVKRALEQEHRLLQPIRTLADIVVDSSRFNVHELRSHITAKFTAGSTDKD
ncbi:MAG TPA: RNase adapter RapZ, partial [Candidatus Angelobacter sp.]|nr:RNase adapter RapZ [Candidatus Angelobacter sp.]